MKKFLILGFGRMGITHLAHINGYYSSNCSFDVYDPNRLFRLMSFFKLRKNISFLKDLPKPNVKYDGVIITSPPKFHSINFKDTLSLSSNFFIEKPLQIEPSLHRCIKDNKVSIYCGYVLRSNPCIEFLKDIFSSVVDPEVKVSVLSNLGQDVADDWRFDLTRGGGCLNELGSHAVNLSLLFSGVITPDQPVKHSINLSVGSFDLSLNSSVPTSVSGDWNTNVRKTMYKVEITGKDTKLVCDLQSVEGNLNGKPLSWSPRKGPLEVGFYIRGIDFAQQCSNWLESNYDEADFEHAILTDSILEDTINNG